RPRAGQGVLILRTAFPAQDEALKDLVIYAAPGIRRLTVIDASRLPSLAPSVSPPVGGFAIASTGKRGHWFRVAYDKAGREGWVEARRTWRFSRWDDFLVGRSAALFPDTRHAMATLRPAPSDDAPSLGSVLPDQRFRIVETRGGWIRVSGGNGLTGWLRWQDRNGKLLIAVE
ncbi:MAG TPA: SH3 domain-containing protein, partial [Geobacteraceae bacterium]|nr:SH3 domain-containing protein [Geobacteraceae bacterium]